MVHQLPHQVPTDMCSCEGLLQGPFGLRLALTLRRDQYEQFKEAAKWSSALWHTVFSSTDTLSTKMREIKGADWLRNTDGHICCSKIHYQEVMGINVHLCWSLTCGFCLQIKVSVTEQSQLWERSQCLTEWGSLTLGRIKRPLWTQQQSIVLQKQSLQTSQ